MLAEQHKWSRVPVSEHRPPQPAGRTLRMWSFQRLVPNPPLLASRRRLHLARPESRIPLTAHRSDTGTSFPSLWPECSPARRGFLRQSNEAKNPTRAPTKEETSGKVTPAQNPVRRKKKKKKRTAKIYRPTKRFRRRQEQGMVSLTRSWIAPALWHPPFLSCKSKQTESDG